MKRSGSLQLSVLGATGGTGREATLAALEAGHTVRALVRTPAKLGDLRERIDVVEGDATDAADVRRAIDGTDVVISALGPDSFRAGGLHERALPLVLDAMRAGGARRLVVVSGAGVDVPGDRKAVGPRLLGRALRLAAGSAIADRQREAELIMASGLEWVIVRPPHLVAGPATGRVRAGTDLQLGLRDRLTRADLGRFLVEQLEDGRYLGRAPFVAEAKS